MICRGFGLDAIGATSAEVIARAHDVHDGRVVAASLDDRIVGGIEGDAVNSDLPRHVVHDVKSEGLQVGRAADRLQMF